MYSFEVIFGHTKYKFFYITLICEKLNITSILENSFFGCWYLCVSRNWRRRRVSWLTRSIQCTTTLRVWFGFWFWWISFTFHWIFSTDFKIFDFVRLGRVLLTGKRLTDVFGEMGSNIFHLWIKCFFCKWSWASLCID